VVVVVVIVLVRTIRYVDTLNSMITERVMMKDLCTVISDDVSLALSLL
jgi:hypothetical protein